MLRENLIQVQENINQACRKAGRDPSEVTLIAVSKTKPVSMLETVYEAGIREFGENKVQELTEKYELLPKDIHWHMIGHLQRNKVKYIVDKACLIHSVDSLRLAEEISRMAQAKQVEADILVEVNIAGEESKFGMTAQEAISLVTEIAALPGIHVRGLMTIAPFVEDPEENRMYFRKMKELSVDINRKNIDNVGMDILSMGMTGDYMVAIEEGATMVRVGTGIFGERQYPGADIQ
ncbi:MAG: YggS family pyridoxal phosphate-dependent enzyme [Lachnospiraceae bacterium]|nr:YggS family pyridoxal phosphate-dependent enzyme [Lachnospiraceae bacterium]